MNRYFVKRIGRRVSDSLHGVDGVKWGIVDRTTGKMVDEDNPSDSRDEARAAARMLNKSNEIRETTKSRSRTPDEAIALVKQVRIGSLVRKHGDKLDSNDEAYLLTLRGQLLDFVDEVDKEIARVGRRYDIEAFIRGEGK